MLDPSRDSLPLYLLSISLQFAGRNQPLPLFVVAGVNIRERHVSNLTKNSKVYGEVMEAQLLSVQKAQVSFENLTRSRVTCCNVGRLR